MKQITPQHGLTKPRSWFAVFHAHGGYWPPIIGVVCVVLTLLSVASYWSADRYDRLGVVAQAQLFDPRLTKDNKGNDKQYYVTFRFDAGGRTIQWERQVPFRIYMLAVQSAGHEIRYLPDQPEKFETYVGQVRHDAIVLQTVSGLAGLMGVVLLWVLGSRTNRAILARKYGYRTGATVTAIKQRRKKARGKRAGCMKWVTDDGITGQSLYHPLSKLHPGKGRRINVYVRKGHSVWEGDVGPAEIPNSAVPKVGR